MKKDYTHITFILDRSGSMNSIKMDTIGGFNTFIDDQKKVDGDCTMTLVQFDSVEAYKVLNDFESMDKVEKLSTDNFVPRGGTPLRDAVGRGINETGAKLAVMKEEDRPEKVIFVILTDGEENSSTEFTQDSQIEKMITVQEKDFNWKFVFLGANQDAMVVARGMGISSNNTLSFGATVKGTKNAFKSVSDNMTYYRGMSQDQAQCSSYFMDVDRDAQKSEI